MAQTFCEGHVNTDAPHSGHPSTSTAVENMLCSYLVCEEFKSSKLCGLFLIVNAPGFCRLEVLEKEDINKVLWGPFVNTNNNKYLDLLLCAC